MPSYECKCGQVFTDISYHWLGKRVQRHLIEDHEGRVIERIPHQITLEGKTAMFIKRPLAQSVLRGETAMPGKWKERESGGTFGGKGTEKGESVEGKIVEVVPNVNAKKDPPELHDFILETKKGRIKVWGSAILENKISEKDIGKEIRVTFDGLGKATRGKNPPKQFTVEVKE